MLRQEKLSISRSDAALDERRVRDLIDVLSWHAGEQWRVGKFRSYLWATENAHGERVFFETPSSPPDRVSDARVLAALRAETRAYFQDDGVVRYAVCFPAIAHVVTRLTVLHVDGRKTRVPVLAFEGHSASGVHLRAERERCLDGSLGALSEIERRKKYV
jgi:hypothetical protein